MFVLIMRQELERGALIIRISEEPWNEEEMDAFCARFSVPKAHCHCIECNDDLLPALASCSLVYRKMLDALVLAGFEAGVLSAQATAKKAL